MLKTQELKKNVKWNTTSAGTAAAVSTPGAKPVKRKRNSYKAQPLSLFLRIIVDLSALITIAVLIAVVGYILIKGIPNITAEQFEWKFTTDNQSMMPAIINTVIIADAQSKT